ncbi:nucleoside-diphosphate sugar epimerase/dehydratase [Corynebacterium sanguinis]
MALGIQLWKPIYRNRIVVSTLDDVPKLIVAVGTVSFLGLVVFEQGWDATRILGFCFFVPAMVILGRAITNVFIRRWRIRNWWARKRTVILGSGETGWDLVRIADAYPELGLETVAVADKRRRDNGDNPYGVDVEVLEKGGLKSLLTRARAQTLIVADSVYSREELLNMLRDCARLDTEVLIVPILTEYVSMGGRMDRIYSYPVLRVRRAAYRSFEWKLKRPIGLILSGLAQSSPSNMTTGSSRSATCR